MRSRHLEGTFGGPGPALIIGPRPNMLDTSSSCPDLVQALCIPRTWEAHSVDLVQHLFSDLVQICLILRPVAQTSSKYARDLVQLRRPGPNMPDTSSNYPAPVQQRSPRTKQKRAQTCGARHQCAKRPVLLVGATENAVWGTGFSTQAGRLFHSSGQAKPALRIPKLFAIFVRLY
jgi:hypothetical protein